jgi:hypothetical protein
MEAYAIGIKKVYTGKNIFKKIVSRLRKPKLIEVKWKSEDSSKFNEFFGESFEEQVMLMVSEKLTEVIMEKNV